MNQVNIGPHLERLRLLYPVRWRIAAGLLCMALTVGAQLAFPQAIAYFIDNVTELTRRGVTPGMVAAMLAFSLLYALAYPLPHSFPTRLRPRDACARPGYSATGCRRRP